MEPGTSKDNSIAPAARSDLNSLRLPAYPRAGAEQKFNHFDLRVPWHPVLEAHLYIPQEVRCPYPLLMIHGAAAGAEIFNNFLAPYLADHGVIAWTFSGRGLGRSAPLPAWQMKLTGLGTEAADARRAAAYLTRETDRVLSWRPFNHIGGDLTQPMLLGFSMGGWVVDRLVSEGLRTPLSFLVASPVSTGTAGTTWRSLLSYPTQVAAGMLKMSFAPLHRNQPIAHKLMYSPRLQYETLGPLVSQADYHYLAYQQSLLPRDLCQLKAGSGEVIVIGGGPGDKRSPIADCVFTAKEVRATAEAVGTEPHFIPESAHMLPLDPQAEKLGALILQILAEKKLLPQEEPR